MNKEMKEIELKKIKLKETKKIKRDSLTHQGGRTMLKWTICA